MKSIRTLTNDHYSDDVLRNNEIKMNYSGCVYALIQSAIMLIFATFYDWSYYNLSTFIVVGAYANAALGIVYVIVCRATKGEPKWLKCFSVGLFILAAMFLTLFASSGLIMLTCVVPVAIASRYYSKRFTMRTSLITMAAFNAIVIAGAYYGFSDIEDLNYVQILPDMSVTVKGSIYNSFKSIAAKVVDRGVYTSRIIKFELIPNDLVFLIILIVCMTITARGKLMIEEQGIISSREAKIKNELATATAIQDNMLAEVFPVTDRYEIYAIMSPAREVGGDFYDFFNLDDDHVAIVIGDVSDKGVPSALLMALGGSIMRSYGELGYSPSHIFKETNRRLCQGNKEGMFITAFFGVVDLKTGAVVYANAGHCAPIIRRADGSVEYLKMEANLFLGSIEGIEYIDQHMQLNQGDKLLLYTDGVTEAMNTGEEFYGKSRLKEIFKNNNKNNAKESVEVLFDDIKEFTAEAEQSDDITMLLFEYKEV